MCQGGIMGNITVPANFTPRDYQKEVLIAMEGIGRPQVKRALLRWHRQSGKDTFCWAYTCLKAATVPANYFYMFPEYGQGRRALWEKLDPSTNQKVIDMIPKELISRRNNQDMLIELINGSTIRIVGSDNYDSIIGITAGGIVFSEYAYSDPMALLKMLPSLDAGDGWMILNSTPNGRNHFFELEQQVKKKNNWFVSELQTMWPDRPNYSKLKTPEQMDDLALVYDHDTLCQEYGVSYTAGIKGSYYSDSIIKAKSEGRINKYPYAQGRKVHTYWDLGASDDTSVWFMQKHGAAYVFIDYFEANKLFIGDMPDILKEKGYLYGTHHLPWDGDHKHVSSRYTAQEILRSGCVHVGISDDVIMAEKIGVQQGITAVRSLFDQCCFDEDKCDDGLKKLEAYTKKWDSKSRSFLKTPKHDWASHAADAFRTFGFFESYETGLERDNYNQRNIVMDIVDFDPLEDE